ncbi:hypothetical protein HDV01_001436 [Terramyces sp. JEL0728]|nr:hypothetical protein HDV01_001436 [Terramyces sp. JEL0728]
MRKNNTCTNCIRKKQKCDRLKPKCSGCQKYGLICAYPEKGTTMGRPAVTEKEIILEEKLKQLEAIILTSATNPIGYSGDFNQMGSKFDIYENVNNPSNNTWTIDSTRRDLFDLFISVRIHDFVSDPTMFSWHNNVPMLRFAIYAFASLIAPPEMVPAQFGNRFSMATAYLEKSHACLSGAIMKPNISHVMAMYILVPCFARLDRAADGYKYFQLAVNAAKEIGLNDEAKITKLVTNAIDQEFHRLLWWRLYVIDIWMGMKFEYLIDDKDNRIYLPGSYLGFGQIDQKEELGLEIMTSEDWFTPGIPDQGVDSQMVLLTRIFKKAYKFNKNYKTKCEMNPFYIMSALEGSLNLWWNNLPGDIHQKIVALHNFAPITDELYTAKILLMLMFYNYINVLIYSPFMMKNIIESPERAVNGHSFKQSLKAARNNSKVISYFLHIVKNFQLLPAVIVLLIFHTAIPLVVAMQLPISQTEKSSIIKDLNTVVTFLFDHKNYYLKVPPFMEVLDYLMQISNPVQIVMDYVHIKNLGEEQTQEYTSSFTLPASSDSPQHSGVASPQYTAIASPQFTKISSPQFTSSDVTQSISASIDSIQLTSSMAASTEKRPSFKHPVTEKEKLLERRLIQLEAAISAARNNSLGLLPQNSFYAAQVPTGDSPLGLPPSPNVERNDLFELAIRSLHHLIFIHADFIRSWSDISPMLKFALQAHGALLADAEALKDSDRNTLATYFLDKSTAHFTKAVASPTVACVMAMLMNSLSYIRLDRANEGFQYFNFTVSIAKNLGINSELKLLALAGTETEREYLRSIWWWIYKWDRFLIYKNKHNLCDKDCNISLPGSSMNAEDVDKQAVLGMEIMAMDEWFTPGLPNQTLPAYRVLLWRIMGKVLQFSYLYQKQESHNPLYIMSTLDSAMQVWKSNLPDYLSFHLSLIYQDQPVQNPHETWVVLDTFITYNYVRVLLFSHLIMSRIIEDKDKVVKSYIFQQSLNTAIENAKILAFLLRHDANFEYGTGILGFFAFYTSFPLLIGKLLNLPEQEKIFVNAALETHLSFIKHHAQIFQRVPPFADALEYLMAITDPFKVIFDFVHIHTLGQDPTMEYTSPFPMPEMYASPTTLESMLSPATNTLESMLSPPNSTIFQEIASEFAEHKIQDPVNSSSHYPINPIFKIE